MAVITTPCYANRQQVQRALDLAETWRSADQVDRALETSARTIDDQLHRVFYPRDTTYFWDFPNYQHAAPWRLWFDQWDLVSATSVTCGGVAIPLSSVIFRPTNRKPGRPYTSMELDRSTTAAFAAGATPQNSVGIAGTWGYTADTAAAGTLAAAISSASATTMTVSDGSLLGVGDLAVCGTERLLVTDRAAAATGQAQSGSGCTTASAADDALTVADGTQVHAGEVLTLDAERMLALAVTGNVVTVKRGWDGTVLAVHSAAAVYADRLLTVARGQLGTTAATHSNAAPVSRHLPPPLIRDLNIAEALNQVLQETSGYSRMVGAGDTAMPASGAGLADKWDEAMQAHGRKARSRAI